MSNFNQEEEGTTFTPMQRTSLFTNPDSVVAPTLTPDPKPTKPIMGDLHESSPNKWIPWTGGKPLFDWSGLDTSVSPSTYSNPTQFRPGDSSDTKPYNFRIRGLRTLFDKSNPVEQFLEDVSEHLLTCGMDSIAYLPDPADPTHMESVVTHHGRFSLDYTIKASNDIKTKWDSFDIANDKAAKRFLINSLKSSFKTRMNKIIKEDDTFATVWIKIMKKVYINSKEYFDSIENKIKALDPRNYPGQKMDDWVADIRVQVQLLSNSGQYDHNLSQDILDLAILAGGDGNEDWRSVIRPLRKALSKELQEIGLFSTKHEVNQKMVDAGLDCEDLLDTIEDEYLTLSNQKKWPPSKNPVDHNAPPSNKFQGDSGLQAEVKTDGTSSSPKKNKSKNFKKHGKFQSSQAAWKTVPPKPGSPETMQKNGRTWHWCQKCNFGKGRWSTTHGTKEHVGGKSSKDKKHQANVTFSEQDEGDDIGVWCTADLVDDDLTFDASFFVGVMGVLFVLYTLYTGMFQIKSTFVNLNAFGSSTPSPVHMFAYFNIPSSLTMLSLLKYAIIGWILLFVNQGCSHLDMWIEGFIAGGHVLHDNPSIIISSLVTILRAAVSVFLYWFDELQGFITRDLFITDNLWFLAPLSWLIVAYVAIYLARRDPQVVYRYVYVKPKNRQKKITHFFKPPYRQTYIDGYLQRYPLPSPRKRKKSSSKPSSSKKRKSTHPTAHHASAEFHNDYRHYSKVRNRRSGSSSRYTRYNKSKYNIHQQRHRPSTSPPYRHPHYYDKHHRHSKVHHNSRCGFNHTSNRGFHHNHCDYPPSIPSEIDIGFLRPMCGRRHHSKITQNTRLKKNPRLRKTSQPKPHPQLQPMSYVPAPNHNRKCRHIATKDGIKPTYVRPSNRSFNKWCSNRKTPRHIPTISNIADASTKPLHTHPVYPVHSSSSVWKKSQAAKLNHQLQFAFSSFHYDNSSVHHDCIAQAEQVACQQCSDYALVSTLHSAQVPEGDSSLLYSYVLSPILNTIKAGGNLLHRVLLSAPSKTLSTMDTNDKFTVIWDTGASISISPSKRDFIKLTKPKTRTTLNGISKGLKVEGEGIVRWCMMDDVGGIRTFEVKALYVPKCKVRLLRPHAITEKYHDESISITDHGLKLSGSQTDLSRQSLSIFISPSNNLPTCSGFTLDGISQAQTALSASVSVVHDSNVNLTNAEKHFLQWHLRLGHPGYNRLMFLFRTGALSTSTSERRKVKSVLNNVTEVPKCAACLFGKQTRKPTPGKVTKVIQERSGVLKQNHLNPGDEASIDHFVCSVLGRLFTSRGKTKDEDMYTGGMIAVDQASNYIFVGFQKHLNSHETLIAKEKFEREAKDQGVIVQKYLTDKGKAFTSKDFSEHLSQLEQIVRFAGVGAHHHNGHAERAIRTIMCMARTMMLHSAIHWPDVADPALWPMAVNHATYLYNRIPDPSTGFSPLDLFSRTRFPLKKLLNMHVWGCPVYVLDKRMGDGKKIPRWQPRSERCMYMGVSPDHSGDHVPLVLNLRTGTISTQYHVVFDDWFSTVPSSPSDIPDFNSDEWKKLFGDSSYQYHIDDDQFDPPVVQESLPNQHYRHQASERKYVSVPIDTSTPTQPYSAPIPIDKYVNAPANPPTDHVSSSLDPPPIVLPPTITSPTKTSNNIISNPPDVVSPNLPTSQPSVPSPKVPSSSAPSPPIDTSFNDSTDSPPEHSSIKESSESKPKFLPSKRPKRNRTRPKYLIEESHHQANVAKKNDDPDIMTWDEAMATPERDEWMKAAEIEIDALEKHGTWKEVPISDAGNAKVLPTTWVFRQKRHPDGTPLKKKGRLAVRGDLEDDGMILPDTYAPVCEFSSVRFFLAFSLLMQWHTAAIDFASAFVQATLPEPVWIYPPRGFYRGKHGTTLLRLIKSLYGLKEAPRLWYDELFQWLLDPELGLTQSHIDKCLLFRRDMIIIIYVDDMGVAAQTEEAIVQLIDFLMKKGFSLTREGTFNEYLGINFSTLPNGSVHMSQSGLIKKILMATGMEACNPNKTPALKASLGKDPNGEFMNEKWNYRSIVGMLLYLSSNTRPDICFAVSQVARFSHSPRKSHASAVKMIIRYLAGTVDQGIIVPPVKTLKLRCYVDADFAGLYKQDPDADSSSAKSRSGFIIFLGSCPLIWKSYLQSEISLSTLEAEYAALSGALRVVLPIINITTQAATVIETPDGFEAVFHNECIVFEDNNGALTLATNQRITSRTKYFNVKYHHFWQHVKDGTIKIEKIPTTDQLADYLTKGLTREIFVRLRKIVQGW